jgi:type I restriction enzyme S subunit
MKAGWQTKPFEECIEKVTYTQKIQRKDFLDDGTYPIVSQEEDFINGYWDNETDLFRVVKPVVVFGDHTKVLKFVDFDFVLGADGVKILQPREFLEPRFFFYQLQAANLDSLGYARHYKLLKELEIGYPARSEQQRIVGILDAAFDGIATAKANAEQNLQNARALFENHLQSVFTQRGEGFTEKKLSDVCAITSTLVDPRKDEFLDLTHVGAGNIVSQTGVFVELKTAREEKLISGKFLFDESMVLYSKIRPYLMKVARPNFSGLCSADMYPLAPLPNEITRDYLFHLLLSKPFTDYAIQGSARAGMPKVNREHLFEFRVWLPEVKKQAELAVQIDALHEETQRLASLYQRKLAALDELKKSLLHQAFSGMF